MPILLYTRWHHLKKKLHGGDPVKARALHQLLEAKHGHRRSAKRRWYTAAAGLRSVRVFVRAGRRTEWSTRMHEFVEEIITGRNVLGATPRPWNQGC